MARAHNLSSNLTMSTYSHLVHQYVPASLHPFVLLSHPVPFVPTSRIIHAYPQGTTTVYEKGPKDVYFVIFAAIGFTLLRATFMRFVFAPFARYMLDRQDPQAKSKSSKKEKKRRQHVVTRFSEQAWSWLYCSVFWSLGVITLRQTSRSTSADQLWGTYPYHPLPLLVKFYYLSQLAWWFHQLYVISTEKRRKDHWQMFSHHWLTIALISSSYFANFTRVGVVVHCLLDFCDIFLPLAKMIRYLGYTTMCDVTFVVFLVGWLVSREIGLLLVIKSVYSDAPSYIGFAWDPPTGRYFDYPTYLVFFTMLSVLWILASVWFYMACMVAVRVVRGEGAEDTRSDGEDDHEEDCTESASGSGAATPAGIDLDMNGHSVLDDIPNCVGSGTSVGNGAGKGVKLGAGVDGIREIGDTLKKRR